MSNRIQPKLIQNTEYCWKQKAAYFPIQKLASHDSNEFQKN
jgi:hypothetical protein